MASSTDSQNATEADVTRIICQVTLHIDDKLWIDVREPTEDILVEIHQEQLIGRRRLNSFTGELMVKIADVSWTFLKAQPDSIYMRDIFTATTTNLQ